VSVEKAKSLVHITRRGVVVWILLIVFIAGWMFVLGIMVGRGSAPIQIDADRLQQELAELKAALTKKEQAEMEAQASGQEDQKTQLGFYEVLKESKRPPSAIPRTRPEAVVKQAPGTAARLPLEGERKPAPSIAPAEQPPVTAKPVGTPASVKPPVAEKTAVAPPAAQEGAFTIQVGAFKDADSAEQVVARLRGQGYPAYQIRSESADKEVWFRVRVGAFKNRAAAQDMLKKLGAAQIKGIIVGTPRP
jgi:DedD protein